MIAFLLTPIGKYAVAFALIVTLFGGFYIKIRSDARAAYEATLRQQEMKRIRDALDNDARLFRELSDPRRLRDDDGFKRP